MISWRPLLSVCGIAIVSLLLATGAAAQFTEFDPKLDMTIDADSSIYDGKTSTIIFKGLHLSQGLISIQADEARVRNKELEDSNWQFSGNVIIDVDNGHIECESANLKFDKFKLKLAVVTGSPATYRLTQREDGAVTHAEAGHLSYRVDLGIIEFSDNAVITDGDNQFSSNFLVYNIAEQRIRADSTGAADGRVRLVYTPTNGDEETGDDRVDDTPGAADGDVENQ